MHDHVTWIRVHYWLHPWTRFINGNMPRSHLHIKPYPVRAKCTKVPMEDQRGGTRKVQLIMDYPAVISFLALMIIQSIISFFFSSVDGLYHNFIWCFSVLICHFMHLSFSLYVMIFCMYVLWRKTNKQTNKQGKCSRNGLGRGSYGVYGAVTCAYWKIDA